MLRRVVMSNIVGSGVLAHAATPLLERTAGHITVIGSASEIVGAPFHSAYVASKRGMHGYFDTLRHEYQLTRR